MEPALNPSLSDLSVPDLSECVMAAAEAVAGSEAEGLKGMWKGRQPDPAVDGPPTLWRQLPLKDGEEPGLSAWAFLPTGKWRFAGRVHKEGAAEGTGQKDLLENIQCHPELDH